MTLRELTMTMGANFTGGLGDAETAVEIRGVGVALLPPPAPRTNATTDLKRLFGLDRLPTRQPPLVCHWQRGPDGRLFCAWRRDTKPAFAP